MSSITPHKLRRSITHGSIDAVARGLAQRSMYEQIDARAFGSELSGTVLQRAIDYASSRGGGTVCGRGLTYQATSEIVIRSNVVLDLEGGTIQTVLSNANDAGVSLRSRSAVCNGSIIVQSTGTPGSQSGCHAPIRVGPLNGNGGTVSNPSEEENLYNWAINNVYVETNADGKVGIQVYGNAHNGLITNIVVPNSNKMFGAVHLDWGYIGNIIKSNIPQTRANFDAGTAYTTHPHDILIANVKVGNLSRPNTGVDTGSNVIRLSGAYNVSILNVSAEACTYAALRITAGDLGWEFALDKRSAMQGLLVENMACKSTNNGWLIYSDSFADNIQGAVDGGYVPLMPPLHRTNMHITHVTGRGDGSVPGLRVIQQHGGTFENIRASGYKHGCLIEDRAEAVAVHGEFYENREHGILIDHPTNPPKHITVLRGTQCYSNGQVLTTAAGIMIGQCSDVTVNGALLGSTSETTQNFGVRASSNTSSRIAITECHVRSVKSGGVAYSLLSSTDYGVIVQFQGNTAAAAITNKVGGLNIVPFAQMLSIDGTVKQHCYATRASLVADTTPSGGTWTAGTVIWYNNPTATAVGTVCTAGGSPGTWRQFGA